MEVEIKEEAQEVVSKYATLETPEPEEKEETETKEEETKEEEAGAEDGKEETAEETQEEEETGVDEVVELRSMLREMKQENLRMKIQLEKVLAVQNGEMGKDPEPGVLETLQTDLNGIAERRGESFTTLIEAMELNPKFEDVREVCSASNFNDIFEAVAKHRSSENGSSFDEELLKAKIEVWKMPNPYKYMYETIKEYHPAYRQKAAPKQEEKKEEKAPVKTAKEILAEAKGREKKPAEAPGSVGALGGGATEQGGWTAAKIDSLPESELRKVPREIYNKWLTGELD